MTDLLLNTGTQWIVCPLKNSNGDLVTDPVADLVINILLADGTNLDPSSLPDPINLSYSSNCIGHVLEIGQTILNSITGAENPGGKYSIVISGSNIVPFYIDGIAIYPPVSNTDLASAIITLQDIQNRSDNIYSDLEDIAGDFNRLENNINRDICQEVTDQFIVFPIKQYAEQIDNLSTLLYLNNDPPVDLSSNGIILDPVTNLWTFPLLANQITSTGRYKLVVSGSNISPLILYGNVNNPSSGSGITPQDISNIPELVWEYPGDRLLSIAPATQADIIGLNDLSASDIGTALETYDALKKTDFDSAMETVNTNIGNVTVDTSGLATAENLETANTNIGLIKATTDYLTLANIRTQVDNGLTAFAGPTKAELEAAFTEIKGAGWTNETLETIKAALITAANVWGYTTRELTSSSSGGATAQEVWEYTVRTLTEVPSGVALATDLGTANGKLDAIKLKTDNIPASAIPSKAEFDSAVGTINTNIGNVTIDTSDLATAENLELANGKLDAIKLKTDTIDWAQIKKQLIMAIGNYQVPVGGMGTYTASISGVGNITFSVDALGNRTLTGITLV